MKTVLLPAFMLGKRSSREFTDLIYPGAAYDSATADSPVKLSYANDQISVFHPIICYEIGLRLPACNPGEIL